MAIINKDKYLREIASLVQKGAYHFEPADRPSLMMAGRKVFISSVEFDLDSQELNYTVSNEKGDVLLSALGERRLAGLDMKTLAAVGGKVREYAELRSQRERNQVNIESRLATVRRNRPALGI